MKKILIFCIFLILGLSLFAQRTPFIIPEGTTRVCSGTEVHFSLLAIEDKQIFQWQEKLNGNWVDLSEDQAQYSFLATSDSPIFKEIRCLWGSDLAENTTVPVILEIIPLPKPEIYLEVHCPETLSLFSSNFIPEDGSFIWILNQEDTSFLANSEYFLANSGNNIISLKFTNQHGCSGQIAESFDIPTPPEVEVKQWFSAACSDSHKKIKLVGLNSELHEIEIFTQINGESAEAIRSYSLDETNTLDFLFNKYDSSQEIELSILVMDKETNCQTILTNSFLLYKDRSPVKGQLIKKPNTQKGLLFYQHDYEDETSQLKYIWGYTKGNGISETLEGSDRNYYDFEEIDLQKIYWVDVYFIDGCQCKTRNEWIEN